MRLVKNTPRVRNYVSPILVLVVALELLFFLADIHLPSGYAKWILYFFPLLLIWNTTTFQILSAVILVSLLNLLGFLLTKDQRIPAHSALLNRISGLVIFWIISIVFILRVKSQESRAKSEYQYKVLIETANSIILRWAPSGRIIFINPYGQRFFGYSEKELYGKNVMILVSDKESAGRDKPSLSVDIANHPERYVTYVKENVRKDGSVVWVSWTNKAIKNQYGEFVEILAIGNDVTSLKRTEQDLRASEKRLRLATDAAQLGIFDWDIENDVTLWDRRMYEIFGMHPDEQPINRDGFAKELIYPADLQRFNEKITKSLNKESTFSGSYRIRRHSDQQVRWIQYFGKLELSGDGRPIRLISTLADVTERKEAEKEIRESEERLRILNENLENLVIKRTEQVRELSKTLTLAEQRERKQFSHILHEDIQQKLFGARMLFKQYLRDLQISEHDSFKEDIEDGISVLELAIKTSKALSIELNPPVLTTEGLDAALRWLVTHMHNTYGLNIELQIYGKVENIRNETQLMMTQMIREILNNVKKHSGVMDGILRVKCKDKNLVVIVKDSGCGFDPSKTFEEKKDNNRLGLLSIKERLNLFGGALTIKSEQGKGTVVKIFLPQQNC